MKYIMGWKLSIPDAMVSDNVLQMCYLDKNNYKQLLGALDYSFLCAYAIGMYLR